MSLQNKVGSELIKTKDNQSFTLYKHFYMGSIIIGKPGPYFCITLLNAVSLIPA